ncbi:MAG: polysaccharide biosynthesis protein [Acinetobacter sp.]|nr:MAG: polysaccharide biosynthesis protein [Acinetobacter sp.]
MSIFDKRILSNSVWMIVEKIVGIFGLIFVTSFVAKYIGPENFGKLAFAGSLFAIIQTLAMFGSDNIIFQKTSKNPRLGIRLIEATKIIRDIVYFLASILLIIYLCIYVDTLTFIFSLASCIAIYFSLHGDTYSIYFNAILQSKINTFCNIAALLVSLILRYLIVELELAIEWLSVPIILLTLIPYVLRKRIFNKRKAVLGQVNHRISTYRNYMLSVGKKMVLYTLSVAIFTKTSQLFLGMKSQHDLGIYTVAATLGTSYYFVLSALISSFMTRVYTEQDFDKNQNMVAQLNVVVIVISAAVWCFFELFGEWVVRTLYGVEFEQVNDILGIMVLACLFSGLSTVAEKYLIKFNAYDFLQKKTNTLVVFNIVVTMVAVYFYGLYGAIFSILATEVISTTLLNYFFVRQKKSIILDTHKRIILPATYLQRFRSE